MKNAVFEEKTTQPRILTKLKASSPSPAFSFTVYTGEFLDEGYLEDVYLLRDEDFQKGFEEAHEKGGRLLDDLEWLR